MCKVYTGYHGTSEIEHGLCTCTVDNPSLKLRDYLSVQAHKPCSISHLNAVPQELEYWHIYTPGKLSQEVLINCRDRHPVVEN